MVILREHPEVIFCVAEYEDRIAGYIFIIPKTAVTSGCGFILERVASRRLPAWPWRPMPGESGIAGRLVEQGREGG